MGKAYLSGIIVNLGIYITVKVSLKGYNIE